MVIGMQATGFAGSRLNAALLDILQEEESLTAKPEEILGDDGSCGTEFGD